jgi:hypothetical protein
VVANGGGRKKDVRREMTRSGKAKGDFNDLCGKNYFYVMIKSMFI